MKIKVLSIKALLQLMKLLKINSNIKIKLQDPSIPQRMKILTVFAIECKRQHFIFPDF